MTQRGLLVQMALELLLTVVVQTIVLRWAGKDSHE